MEETNVKLKLTKYTPISHGVQEHPNGYLLQVGAVYEALEYIIDDDELVAERVRTLLDGLKL